MRGYQPTKEYMDLQFIKNVCFYKDNMNRDLNGRAKIVAYIGVGESGGINIGLAVRNGTKESNTYPLKGSEKKADLEKMMIFLSRHQLVAS